MPIYQVRMVHYDGNSRDILIEVEADSASAAKAEANKRAFGTKWWPQEPELKTWGRKNYACKPKRVVSD